MDIGQVLENAILGRDQQIRAEAEAQLEQAAKEHFVPYMGMLTQALGGTEQRTEVRMLAGIALKNQITAKDPRIKLRQADRWVALETPVKDGIKNTSLEALLSPDDRVANAAAQLVAAIADVELPRNEWPTLTTVLINNTKPEQATSVKRASLLAIGYICETADPSNIGVVAQASGLLTAIIQGAHKDEQSDVVRLTAINALVNSLEFIQLNFNQENERNYIMQVVCEATQAENTELKAAAFGALCRIMSLYYQYMQPYMERALFGLTVSGMQSANEPVACMAVEFWSTVCEEEIELTLQRQELGGDPNGELPPNYEFARYAISQILPTLLALLTRRDEDEDHDDDEWSVDMAAAACLQLFAQNVQDAVVAPTLTFVDANVGSPSWVKREAAVMAFGSILEGPDPERLKPMIQQALGPLLALMGDSSASVKDTVAWCLGRVADVAIDAIDVSTHLPVIINAVLSGLGDHPKVSTNCCWTVMNLAEQLAVDIESNTSPMSQYYPTLVPALLQAASRSDNENSCRSSAYEALSTLVIFSTVDVLQIVLQLSSPVLERLQQTIPIQQQLVSNDDRVNLEELQNSLLGLLAAIIRRVQKDVLPASDQLMTLLLQLLQTKLPNSLIEEDVFLAIGAIAGAIDSNFTRFLDTFMPYLFEALRDPEYQICNTAVGLVADICHSVGAAVEPYCNTIMSTFVEHLGKDDVRRDVKLVIVSCIGDIATFLGGKFEPYLPVIMQVLAQASSLQADQDASQEFIEYVYGLRDAILDAYVGIVAGMRDRPDLLLPYIKDIFAFVSVVVLDGDLMKSDRTVRSLVGLVGDVGNMYPNGEVAPLFNEQWVTDLIRKARDRSFATTTRETARWAREQQRKQQSLAPSA